MYTAVSFGHRSYLCCVSWLAERRPRCMVSRSASDLPCQTLLDLFHFFSSSFPGNIFRFHTSTVRTFGAGCVMSSFSFPPLTPFLSCFPHLLSFSTFTSSSSFFFFHFHLSILPSRCHLRSLSNSFNLLVKASGSCAPLLVSILSSLTFTSCCGR